MLTVKASFKKQLIIDIKYLIKKKQVYICFAVMLISCFSMFYRNSHISEISNQMIIGTLNMFIYGAIYNNPIMGLLAPFIASAICSADFLPELEDRRNLTNRSYTNSALSSSIRTGLFFALSYTTIFVIMFIIDPRASSRQNYYEGSLFISVYDRSMLVYCICNILYDAIYSAVYSLLAFGLINLSMSKYIGMIIPGVMHYMLIYVAVTIVPNVSKSIFAYIVPFQTYDTTAGMGALRYLGQIATVLIVAVIINALALRRASNWGKN